MNCIPLPYLILRRIFSGSESVSIDALIGLGFFSYGMRGVCSYSTHRRNSLPMDAKDILENSPIVDTKSDDIPLSSFGAHGWNASSTKRLGSFNLLALFLTFLTWYMLPPPMPFQQPFEVRSLLSSPLFHDFASDSFLLPRSAFTRRCKRQPLISHRYVLQNPHPNDNDTYAHLVGNAFDDTLLIVLFSHARYDVNLDLYLETYTPYFANVRISLNYKERKKNF
jgi:hypothetical protein